MSTDASLQREDGEETITLNVGCHCRAVAASYTLPVSAFPLKSALCCCTTCRLIGGQMWACFAVMPAGHEPPASDALKAYQISERMTTYFCRVCGASVYNWDPVEWELCSGLLSVKQREHDSNPTAGDETREGKGRGIEGLLDRQLLFVESPPDGGGVIWMPRMNSAGREMKRHSGFRKSPEVDLSTILKAWSDKQQQQQQQRQYKQDEEEEDQDRLTGQCLCGAVMFFIARPVPNTPRADRDRGRWWLADPGDPSRCTKYTAKLDACDSCRLATGMEVCSWIIVPAENVFVAAEAGPARPFDVHDPGLNLTHYSSSQGNWRGFCSTCGSPICFWSLERDVPVLDFGTGLFQYKSNREGGEESKSKLGARLEDWVLWKGLQFSEDAMDGAFVNEIVARIGKKTVRY